MGIPSVFPLSFHFRRLPTTSLSLHTRAGRQSQRSPRRCHCHRRRPSLPRTPHLARSPSYAPSPAYASASGMRRSSPELNPTDGKSASASARSTRPSSSSCPCQPGNPDLERVRSSCALITGWNGGELRAACREAAAAVEVASSSLPRCLRRYVVLGLSSLCLCLRLCLRFRFQDVLVPVPVPSRGRDTSPPCIRRDAHGYEPTPFAPFCVHGRRSSRLGPQLPPVSASYELRARTARPSSSQLLTRPGRRARQQLRRRRGAPPRRPQPRSRRREKKKKKNAPSSTPASDADQSAAVAVRVRCRSGASGERRGRRRSCPPLSARSP